MDDSPQFTKAYNKAVELLTIRTHSSFELEQKLKRKGFNKEIIDQVVLDLKEKKYLNDEDAARSYLQSLINYKTYGYYGLKSKLLVKGIKGETAENLLIEMLPIEVEQEIAEKLIKKNRLTGVKIASSLRRKGFRSEIISKFIKY